MCEPMTWLALGTMVAGAGLQYKANKDREGDMRKVQRRETERQTGLYREAEGNLVKNRDSYTRENVEGKMDMAADERQAQYARAESVAPRTNEAPAGAAAGGGNQVIQDAFSRAMEGAKGQATQQGALRSQLASFGDMMGANAIENNRRTGDIGMIGSFSKGSSEVMPHELNHQMTRERSSQTWGQVLQALGGAMLGGAGMGAGAAGAAGAGATGVMNPITGAMISGGTAAGSGAASGIPWGSIFSGAASAGR